MAMGTTTAKNRCKRPMAARFMEDASKFISTSVSFNQGDILAVDTSAHVLKAVSADADTGKVLGVAPVTVVSGKLKSIAVTDVDASQGVSAVGGPFTGVHRMLLKTGDAFNPGDAVYVDTANTTGSAQQVTVTAPGMTAVAVGVFQDAAVASAAAGQEADVFIGRTYLMTAGTIAAV